MWRALLASALAVQTIGQTALPPSTSDQRFEVFGSYLESLRAQARIPGMSAAIVGAEQVVWERPFGDQDLERSIPTRTDTLFHVDGLTQILTTGLVLRCVEEGKLSLSDRLGRFDPASPDGALTIEQALSHTSGAPRNLVFSYRPASLGPLAGAIEQCEGPFRAHAQQWLRRMGMFESVPGPDVIQLPLPEPLDPDVQEAVDRYRRLLERTAVSYSISKSGRATPSPSRAAETLTPASGLVTTAGNFARLDLALREAILVRRETLAAAWMSPIERFGQPLPHGLGWFVQTFAGEQIAWQFGVSDGASSSLIVTVPGRGFSVIVLANSDGLVNPYGLANGDLTASPFGRLILGMFVR